MASARSQVRLYSGETSYRVVIGGLARDLPIVEVAPQMWIASNAELILGDVEFLTKASKILAGRIRKARVDVVVTAEAKSIALAFGLSKELGHTRFLVARKSLKSYMSERLTQPVRSITTSSEQVLILTQQDAAYIRGKRVCVLDDVVSTGGTLKALEALVKKAGGIVECRAALWREGPWYRDKRLVSVSTLPVFVGSSHPLASGLPRRDERR